MEIDYFWCFEPENFQLYTQSNISDIIKGNQYPDHKNSFTLLKIDISHLCIDFEFWVSEFGLWRLWGSSVVGKFLLQIIQSGHLYDRLQEELLEMVYSLVRISFFHKYAFFEFCR